MTCHIMEKSPPTLSSMYVRSVLFRALRIAATMSGALPPDINKKSQEHEIQKSSPHSPRHPDGIIPQYLSAKAV